jgi:hypothetical protein
MAFLKNITFVVLLLQDGFCHLIFKRYITGNRQSQPISRQDMHLVAVLYVEFTGKARICFTKASSA